MPKTVKFYKIDEVHNIFQMAYYKYQILNNVEFDRMLKFDNIQHNYEICLELIEMYRNLFEEFIVVEDNLKNILNDAERVEDA